MCFALNSRSGRALPTNERVHLTIVPMRLPNPLMNARWMNAQTTQPGKPLR